MFRELIEHKINNRGRIVAVGEILPVASDFTRYCSMFMFGNDIHAHVKAQKGVTGFKGKTYCEAIWIDIDYGQDVNEARLSAIQLVKRINAEYQINPDHLFIYFSGFKGFHIALFNTLVGFDHNTPIESDKVKDFVRRLTAGINHVDLVIYEPVRIFRIENSKHEKSGLYKIRISFDELQCELEDIKALAANPRKYPYTVNRAGFKTSEGLNKLWINSGNYVHEQREIEHKGNLFAPPVEGSRNKTLLVQACTLFRKSELSSNAILDIISNAAFIANLNATDKVDQAELKRIVTNAERLVGDERKKPKVDEEITVRSFGEYAEEYERYILQQETPMTLCFSDINQIMKGRLKGKLGVSMGYGGSKKSLHALNLCLQNKEVTEEIAVYSTMEMSVPQLMDRIIDHEVKDPDGKRNANQILSEMYKKDVNDGRKFLVGELSKMLGNKLQITQNSRMTYEGYKKAIKIVRETAGDPWVLVVDGLSMMGGKGTETEVYSRNSAELKELAKEEDIFVLLICHVSKGAEKWTRDLSRWIRGSEKILDNCDFYYTMSQINDADNPEFYRNDKGFISFHDKRGSGQTVEVVYNFDPQRLRLSDSFEDPSIYRDPTKGNKAVKSQFDI